MQSTTSSPEATSGRRRPKSARERGQAIVIFAAAIVFFVGFLAIVVDVTWYWVNQLRVQRAADAAALAGAVWLPDTPGSALTTAVVAARQNGYSGGSSGCGTPATAGTTVVTAQVNPARDVQLDTCVSAPVPTFFMRLFGINTLQATRTARAEFQLKLAMGSPINYLGAFGKVRSTGYVQQDTGALFPTTTLDPAIVDTWTDVGNAFSDEGGATTYATVNDFVKKQTFAGFTNLGPPLGVPADARVVSSGLVNGGIRVFIRGHGGAASNCRIGVELSWNNGVNWTSGTGGYQSAALPVTDDIVTLGQTSDSNSGGTGSLYWWGRKWLPAEFAPGKFAVRLQALSNGAPCTSPQTTSIDYVQVQVDYEAPSPPIKGPNSEDLVDQGAWAAVNSQGEEVVDGDAYSVYYNSNPSTNSLYAPQSYYDYAVEIPAGATNGKVWIFDPGFCATDGGAGQGVGDRWYSGTNGMSTFYDVYDTNNTDWDYSDDTWKAGQTGPSGASNPTYGLFRKLKASDTSLGGPSLGSGIVSCKRGAVPASQSSTNGNYWHLRWWPLATGLSGPTNGAATKIYRVRITSTDPAATTDQRNVKAENNFAIFASATGGTPYVHGFGSMMIQTPLDGGSVASLYLAQVRQVYAGKVLAIDLYDPGDTQGLPATMRILDPSGAPATFSYIARKVATSGSNCNSLTGTNVTSVVTNNGSTQPFNGCWLQISIRVPLAYTAPNGGWWKIQYTMGGSTSTNAVDVTTWKASLGGSPVHLILPGP
jgi:Flp pilus assembly protein TadG